ncbi:hypothetical protein F2981_23270 (plasmid) [Sinorhizobium meliloti]|nr:hypothetical protein [Sinorhizobium meliloti]
MRNTNAIAPVALDVARLVGGQRHGSRRDPDFADRICDPHQTLWADHAEGRALPPSAKLLYDLILKQSRA